MTHFRLEKSTGFNPQPKTYTKPKEPKPLKKVSEKRKVDTKSYNVLKKVFLENYPNCMIKQEGCTKRSVDIHHSFSGKDRDKYFLELDTWFSACRSCHKWIHAHPKEAREQQFLK